MAFLFAVIGVILAGILGYISVSRLPPPKAPSEADSITIIE